MNKKIFSLLAVLGFVSIITYCSSDNFGRFLTRSAGNTPNAATPTVQTAIPPPAGSDTTKSYFSVTDNWVEHTNSSVINPEIVFFLDSSGSMSSVTAALTNSFISWMGTIENLGVSDYCIDLITSVSDSYAGKLEGADGKQCFCRHDLSPAQIQADFGDAVAAVAAADPHNTGTGPAGNGDSTSEDGLYSLHTALTNAAVLAANQTAGCFRNDMTLVPILASDEQDIALANNDAGCDSQQVQLSDGSTTDLSTAVFDNSFSTYAANGWSQDANHPVNYNPTDCTEAQNRLLRYSNPVKVNGKFVNAITPQSVANEVIAYNQTLPTFANAITYPNTANPLFASKAPKSPGFGLLDLADFFGNTPIDLSIANSFTQNEFDLEMDTLAVNLVRSISFLRKFDLSSTVCKGQESSLVVKLNGTALAASKYTLSADDTSVSVVPTLTLHENDAIAITYIKCS